MKVLIAEDMEFNVILLEELLDPYNFTITKATNGREAVEMFTKEFSNNAPYELIFMDIMMPEVDGVDAVMKIREFEKRNSVPPEGEAKIIMTTAVVDKKIILKLIMLGRIIGYLTKPIDHKRLKELIENVVTTGSPETNAT